VLSSQTFIWNDNVCGACEFLYGSWCIYCPANLDVYRARKGRTIDPSVAPIRLVKTKGREGIHSACSKLNYPKGSCFGYRLNALSLCLFRPHLCYKPGGKPIIQWGFPPPTACLLIQECRVRSIVTFNFHLICYLSIIRLLNVNYMWCFF